MKDKEKHTSVCGAESCARRRISEVTTTESTMRHSFQYTVGKLQSPCSLAPAPALPAPANRVVCDVRTRALEGVEASLSDATNRHGGGGRYPCLPLHPTHLTLPGCFIMVCDHSQAVHSTLLAHITQFTIPREVLSGTVLRTFSTENTRN